MGVDLLLPLATGSEPTVFPSIPEVGFDLLLPLRRGRLGGGFKG